MKLYTCDLIQIFEDTDDGPSIMNSNIACDIDSDDESNEVNVAVDMKEHNLSPDLHYIFCVTLLHEGHVIPGCSGPIVASHGSKSPMPHVRITSLHGNVSLTHNMTVHVTTSLPGSMLAMCRVLVSVSLPGQPPVSVDSYTCDAGLSEADYNIGEGDLSHIQYCNIEAVVTDLPRHSYYNVCAELRLPSDELRLASSPVIDSQCMILHSNTIVRYQTRFGN